MQKVWYVYFNVDIGFAFICIVLCRIMDINECNWLWKLLFIYFTLNKIIEQFYKNFDFYLYFID